MKRISKLQLGFADAENYKRRENKALLNSIFIRNKYLDKLCEPAVSFLVGEKGTGKTAYAIFMSNNDFRDTLSDLKYIRETEYQKFIAIKREKHLDLSDFTSIWKVILYLLISQQVSRGEGGLEFLRRFTKLAAVQKAIDEYYSSAFSPEIIQALQFVKETKRAAELMAKYAKAVGEEKDVHSFTESRFQTNLFYIQKKFENAISQMRCRKNHILFIDGIDIRPSSIPYHDYLECIKGLANAVWEVNNDFFPGIRDAGGRLRVVLLIRPDIFESIGLQNQNTKMRDNSVFLDWRTEYANHRRSDLFRITDHLLASNQEGSLTLGEAWDHYFPWNAPNLYEEFTSYSSFVSFLRWSYYRPRDIVTMLSILQDLAKERDLDQAHFDMSTFEDSVFKRRYSNYLLGEVKDHLTFYYSAHDYEEFLKFFTFLNGKRKFDYRYYLDAFRSFQNTSGAHNESSPRFMSGPESFLQFLYDLNILAYIESPQSDQPYVRWCFRERSYANIAPKVKLNLEYQIFYGLSKALNVGAEFETNV